MECHCLRSQALRDSEVQARTVVGNVSLASLLPNLPCRHLCGMFVCTALLKSKTRSCKLLA